jgi:hypothetical protein
VYDQCTSRQYDQAGYSPKNDAYLSVPTETDGQRDNTDRNNKKQQFRVQVVVVELTQKWQKSDDKRQQKTVQKTQPGQSDGNFVE